MKFNHFLLLLTTLIATVLGQIPYRVKVSINPGFATSWAVDETGGVVLEEIGNLWILEFHGFRGFRISPDNHEDKAVRCNGLGKQLTIEPREEKPDQIWHIHGPIDGPIFDVPVAIRSDLKFPVMFAALNEGSNKVVAGEDNRRQWIIRPILE